MTPTILLEKLKEFIEKKTEDIILPVRPVKNKTLPATPKTQMTEAEEITERAAEVHIQNLPDKTAEVNRVPYILIRLLTGKDEQLPGEMPYSECKIRIITVTYSENDSLGDLDVLNIITRIRIALLKKGEIGQQFLLKKPLEYIVYEDETSPYHIAEMIVSFEMPEIAREVHTHYLD